MIRLKRKTDDKIIHSLIRTELIPLTQKTFPHVKYNKAEINKRLRRGLTFVYISKSSNPIGFIHTIIKGKTQFIDMLVVKKGVRNKGIGSKLMAKANSIALRNKCSRSQLYVDYENDQAQKFYFKQGYEVEKYEQSIHCFLLSKKITQFGVQSD